MYCELIPQLPSGVGSQGRRSKCLSQKGWWVSLHFTSFLTQEEETPPKLRVGTSPPAKYTAGSILLLMHGCTSAKQFSVQRKEANKHRASPSGRGKSSASPLSLLLNPFHRGLLFPLLLTAKRSFQ